MQDISYSSVNNLTVKEFAERLRELREEKGLTRAELANKTGFTEVSIGRWEKAETIPDIKTLIVFIKFFGCDANYILGLTSH